MKRRITKMVLLTFTLSMCAAVPSFADVEQNEFASAEANGKYLSENKSMICQRQRMKRGTTILTA